LKLLIDAARGAPIALCLRKPSQSVGDIGVAQAAVGAVLDNFTSSVAYVSSCELSADASWQQAVGRAVLGNENPPAGTDDALFPLTVGTIAHVRPAHESDLGSDAALAAGDDRYVLAEIDATEPVNSTLTGDASDAIRNDSALALVLVRPDRSLDPTTLLASIRDVNLTDSSAPQGYSNVGATWIGQAGAWQDSIVGTATYRRTDASGASMTTTFVGTQIHLIAIRSPDAGDVEVWLDATPGVGEAQPFAVIDLSAEQARDDAISLVADVPASRHQITIVTDGGEVAVAGFFVAGKQESAVTSALAALGLVVIAVAALADACYSAVSELRARAGITDRPLRAGEYQR